MSDSQQTREDLDGLIEAVGYLNGKLIAHEVTLVPIYQMFLEIGGDSGGPPSNREIEAEFRRIHSQVSTPGDDESAFATALRNGLRETLFQLHGVEPPKSK